MTEHGNCILMAASLRSIRLLSKKLNISACVAFSGPDENRPIVKRIAALLDCKDKAFTRAVHRATAAGDFGTGTRSN